MTTQLCSIEASAAPPGTYQSRHRHSSVGRRCREYCPAARTAVIRRGRPRAVLIEIMADGGMRLCPRGPTVPDRSMPPAVPLPHDLIKIAETLCIAAVGGIGLSAAGFPGGLVSGSMLAVAIA